MEQTARLAMTSDDWVVFDIEIRVSPDDLPNRWNDKAKMGFACAVAWVEREQRFRLFDQKNASELLELLDNAEVVVGFNHIRFDYQVMACDQLRVNRIPVGQFEGEEYWPATTGMEHDDFDILIEIWRALNIGPKFNMDTHAGYGLDAVARATLGDKYHKTGHGAHAPRLFQQGRWAELFDYCQQDVRLTRDLFRFIRENGFVKTKSGLLELK